MPLRSDGYYLGLSGGNVLPLNSGVRWGHGLGGASMQFENGYLAGVLLGGTSALFELRLNMMPSITTKRMALVRLKFIQYSSEPYLKKNWELGLICVQALVQVSHLPN